MDKNIEIDLFQENMNNEMKKLIFSMGANKTERSIERATRASGGVKKVVESFDKQARIHRRSSSHSHKSLVNDETIVHGDLRQLRPFKPVDGRVFESFKNISYNPTHTFQRERVVAWVEKHKDNILMHFPVSPDVDDENDEN